MSLFGTSPEQSEPANSTNRARNSLFDDEPSAAPGAKSSLFADDEASSGTSPWDMPPVKKAVKEDIIKSLLPSSDVPDTYVDIFDNLLKSGVETGGKISPTGVGKVLSAAELSSEDQSRIKSIIARGDQGVDLGRNEFNVLLALIGLAQEHEDITLDGVDERRRNLPVPRLPSLPTNTPSLTSTSTLAAKPAQNPDASRQNDSIPKADTKPTKDAIDEADPWGGPAMHQGHNHSNDNSETYTNGNHRPVRTTSNFTTASTEGSANRASVQPSSETNVSGSLWESYAGADSTASFPVESALSGDGFGSDAVRSAPSRALGGSTTRTGSNVEETVTIALLPEKEGVFMFQHHNYQITSPRRSSKVVRRYSDFVWLLDCLQKRYPFRQLPLLPPKRVGVNGNHLAADNSFIEKRRRGLTRFCNALVRHPVLNQEQLVIMFLTVPTELAVWRKQATISVQEEFVGRTLPAGLQDSLSPTLTELFETSRSGIRRSAEIYITLCNHVDRLCKRNEGLAADHMRLSSLLQNLVEVSNETYATDTNDVPLLNEGLQSTAKHMSNSQSLLDDEARAWDLGLLEDLKRQRDALVSMRDMFDRKDRYDKDNIPQLQRRIQVNETKLNNLRAKPEGLIKPGETEKVNEAIIRDKESIDTQHARGVFIRECIRDELVNFQSSQYHVSRWNQDWSSERIKYAELQADNWKQLNEELESMPVGE